MQYRKISCEEALNILTTDETFRKTVFFGVSKNRTDIIPYDGKWVNCISVDRGQISSKSTILELISKSLFNGIYVAE